MRANVFKCINGNDIENVIRIIDYNPSVLYHQSIGVQNYNLFPCQYSAVMGNIDMVRLILDKMKYFIQKQDEMKLTPEDFAHLRSVLAKYSKLRHKFDSAKEYAKPHPRNKEPPRKKPTLRERLGLSKIPF